MPVLVACSQILLLLCCAEAATGAPLFAEDGVLEVELRGPVGHTIRDKRKRRERPFELVLEGSSWPVAVRVRGKSRLKQCRFPPLRLNFRAADVEGGPLDGLDKVKLVTHCRDASHYEANLLEEFASYRMFALLSEFGHRVRLMRIRYVDTSRPNADPLVRYGFAIEPLENVAARTATDIIEVPHVAKSDIAVGQAALVFVYQYLIANVDWSLVRADGEDSCCHNVGLLRKDEASYIVPYDFDLSGFIDARYAKPDASLPIRRVTTRLYRGYCVDGLDLQAAIDTILAKESEILAEIAALPNGGAEESAQRVAFLATFFDEAKGGALAAHFEAECVG